MRCSNRWTQATLRLEVRSEIAIDPGRCDRSILAMPGDTVANAYSDHVRAIQIGRTSLSCRSDKFERNFTLANDISPDCARTGLHTQPVCGFDGRIHPRCFSPDAPSEPNLAANALLICLWFTAVGLAALTLGSPPSVLNELGWHFGPFEAAPIIWSAITSVGVAGFGANAQPPSTGRSSANRG